MSHVGCFLGFPFASLVFLCPCTFLFIFFSEGSVLEITRSQGHKSISTGVIKRQTIKPKFLEYMNSHPSGGLPMI